MNGAECSAGSDNTSTTMSLAFYFMLAQPKYYAMLQKELDDTFPDRSGHLDPAKLAGLSFLNAVLNEALRLGSPFFLPRIVPTGGTNIDGNYVPEGTVVALAAYSQQVSPDNYWPEPLVSRHIWTTFMSIGLIVCVSGLPSGTLAP